MIKIPLHAIRTLDCSPFVSVTVTAGGEDDDVSGPEGDSPVPAAGSGNCGVTAAGSGNCGVTTLESPEPGGLVVADVTDDEADCSTGSGAFSLHSFFSSDAAFSRDLSPGSDAVDDFLLSLGSGGVSKRDLKRN